MNALSHILTFAHIATAAWAGAPAPTLGRRTFDLFDAAPIPQPAERPGARDGTSSPLAAAPQPAPAFAPARVPLHADKIGFYVVPDIDATYLATVDVRPEAPCRWPDLFTTMQKMKMLLPEAQLRWDNESGHNNNTQGFVESMVKCANASAIPMIITASAVDGYNNFWADNNTQPTVTIQDIAEGPYIAAAYDLMQRYENVLRVETINEVDGLWFVADPDNVTGFDLYMDRAIATFGDDASRLLGPATAFRNSQIYSAYLARPNISDISYHNYQGAQSLTLVPAKTAWITEYGGAALNPAAILDDFHAAVTSHILDDNDADTGSIGMLYYNQLTDNGDNRGAWNNLAREGDHFAFRDWFRALTLVRAAAAVAPQAYTDGNADFLATDDGSGGFAVLFWNRQNATLQSATRYVRETSVAASAPLYLTTVVQGDAEVATCAALAASPALSLQVHAGSTAVLQVNSLPPLAAVLVSTSPCDALAD